MALLDPGLKLKPWNEDGSPMVIELPESEIERLRAVGQFERLELV